MVPSPLVGSSIHPSQGGLPPGPVDALGYPVYDDAQVVGHFERFHEDLVVALNVVDALVSSPASLAWLLDAAGGLALEHAGKIAVEHTLPEF